MTDMSIARGAQIRKLRREKGFDSIEAFARALGWSWITVSRYERGKSNPSIERLYKIADVLGVPIEDLLTEEKVA